MERAAQLALKLGRKQQPFLEAMQYVEELVARFSPHDSGLCCSRLMELLQQFDVGDAAAYARISEMLAERVESNDNPIFAPDSIGNWPRSGIAATSGSPSSSGALSGPQIRM